MADDSFFELFSLAQIEALTEREQSILALRYGLAGEVPHTLEQVAQIYALSRERIRQLVGRSIRKIRHRGRREITKEKTTEWSEPLPPVHAHF